MQSVNTSYFLPILAGFLAFFAWSAYSKISLVKLGMPTDRKAKTGEMFKFAIGQKRVIKGPFGMNHAMLFWSFLVLLVANGDFLLSGLFSATPVTLLPKGLYSFVMLAFDIVSLIALIAVVSAFIRRLVAPPYKGSQTVEAFIILSMIATLMVAYFALHGAESAMEGVSPWYLPISGLFAKALMGADAEYLHTFATTAWWIHAVVLLVFMNLLPYSKHMHILTAIPNVLFKRDDGTFVPEREEFAIGNEYGTDKISRFTWKDLLDTLSCTECGRCQNNCPAAITDKTLNPRTLIHTLKENLTGLKSGEAPVIETGTHSISKAAIWDCMTCGSCMEQCPVFIEHMPKLLQMRRYLVETKSDFPKELLTLFENMEQRSNPWGIAPGERGKWASQIEVKDFGDDTEYLLYAGCAGSFDSRSKQVTLSMAKILDSAGVSWGILGKDEPCCGDSLRRLGNEYVFDKIAKQNVELFKTRGVKKIITQCPHCFTTLKNDYKQFGIEAEVVHHSEFIDGLIKDGKLKLEAKETSLTYHDSCYLGRHNDVYEAPRNVAVSAGATVLEMEKNREVSFCCGAGGGRMWLEEMDGSRVNANRANQALETGAKEICTACPYCMTMFEDGLKDAGKADVKVRDLAELVAERIK